MGVEELRGWRIEDAMILGNYFARSFRKLQPGRTLPDELTDRVVAVARTLNLINWTRSTSHAGMINGVNACLPEQRRNITVTNLWRALANSGVVLLVYCIRRCIKFVHEWHVFWGSVHFAKC